MVALKATVHELEETDGIEYKPLEKQWLEAQWADVENCVRGERRQARACAAIAGAAKPAQAAVMAEAVDPNRPAAVGYADKVLARLRKRAEVRDRTLLLQPLHLQRSQIHFFKFLLKNILASWRATSVDQAGQ